jgi:hypothetical protein
MRRWWAIAALLAGETKEASASEETDAFKGFETRGEKLVELIGIEPTTS